MWLCIYILFFYLDEQLILMVNVIVYIYILFFLPRWTVDFDGKCDCVYIYILFVLPRWTVDFDGKCCIYIYLPRWTVDFDGKCCIYIYLPRWTVDFDGKCDCVYIYILFFFT